MCPFICWFMFLSGCMFACQGGLQSSRKWFVRFCNQLALLAQERLAELLRGKCKCRTGDCYSQYRITDVQKFMDMFEERKKREQDAIIFLAVQDGMSSTQNRRDYFFLNLPIKRSCFERLLGISSHRLDKAGAIDRRYRDARDPSRPSPLTASVDSFLLVLYNSIAEPLPNKLLSHCP